MALAPGAVDTMDNAKPVAHRIHSPYGYYSGDRAVPFYREEV